MNDLQVLVSQTPGEIRCNFDELKEKLSAKMEVYRGATFSEDSKALAKAELASLRKLRESVEKRRKEVKTQVLVPYTEFEGHVKELIEIIDEPIGLIDKQLKEMESLRIEKRRNDVRQLWEKNVEDYAEYLPFEQIYDGKWNNSTTSLKNIEKDLLALVDKTESDIAIISGSGSDIADEALDTYRKSRDLTKALTQINMYEANKKKALEAEAERRRMEHEWRLREEIDRAKAEERQKLLEIERAREEERKKLEENIGFVASQAETAVPFSVHDEIDDLPFQQPETVTAFYKVVATKEELEEVEMAFNSIGIYFERREA